MNTKQLLDALLKKQFLTLPNYQTLLEQTIPLKEKEWFSSRLLLAGSLFVLAGVICFFAANWQHLGQVLKLALPLAGLLACGLGAWYKGVQSAAGQAFGFGAGVLIGVFLAVFGQVYQTGAFVYQLFGPWCLLLVPLAVVLRNKWFWLMTVYVGAVYWISKNFSWSTPSWPLWYGFNGLFIAAWALAEVFTRRSGVVFSRFLWVPFSVFNLFIFVLFLSSPDEWTFFTWALAFAAAALVYAWCKKDIVLWAWNCFMAAGLGSIWVMTVAGLIVKFFICVGFFIIAGGVVAFAWPHMREDKQHA